MADSADQVTVKSPYGQLGVIPKTSLQAAVKQGFQIPSDDEIQSYNDQQEYGTGVGNAAKTFGEAALGSLTLGGSRVLENAMGVTTPEAQAARAKYNPVSRTAGDVAGIGAGIAMTGGAEGLAEAPFEAADLANPIGAIAKAGAKTSAAVSSAIPEGQSIASQLASRALSTGAGSAVEGAAYGLGQSVTEQALGDPDLNAEKVMSNVGYGALFGGALGSALGVGEIAVPAAVGKAQETLEKAKNALLGADDEVGPLGKLYAKASSFVSGKPEESILEGLQRRQDLIENPDTREQIAQNFSDSMQDHFSQINDALKAANRDARPDEIQYTLKSMPVDIAQRESAGVWTKLDQTVQEMKNHAPLYR